MHAPVDINECHVGGGEEGDNKDTWAAHQRAEDDYIGTSKDSLGKKMLYMLYVKTHG